MLSLRSLAAAWNRFFFDEVSALPVAAFRIALGFLAFIDGLMLFPYRLTWFGDQGVLSYATARQYTGSPRLDLFALWPHGDTGVTVFMLLHLLAAVCVSAGFLTRPATVALFLSLVTLHHRNVLILNSGDTELRVFSFFLIFAPAGATWSVDRWLLSKRKKPLPPLLFSAWPLRLLQIQFSLIYGAAALWKLQGADWLDGTALYYASRLVEFQRFALPFGLFDHMWFIAFGTYATLIIEGMLAVAVWIKELRPFALLAGLGLHLFIEYTMNIPLFEWISIALLLLFVEPAELERARAWVTKTWSGS